ncbi:MAG: Asp-tRNA(Asn)/Glu-tRNA(Gln) amidotransferase subunit GatA [Bacteroidetes bacterium]|nr:MAG: Asp-tRNA(Asn)/Glu-tRNA(Gln) amidotransferase subunit GatA [Bacteroidota bacterium]
MGSYDTLSSLQAALFSGKTTCRKQVQHYLEQIERTRKLNAFVEVWAEEALARADQLDARLAGKAGTPPPGKLFGAVVSIKDNICYAGHVVTAGSGILGGFSSLYSATAVERILAEDAIIIGRTNCDEFGMGSSNENSVYGPVRNAADPRRVPGGSSGGAAVAVQTGSCLVALGSDTGGSVRQPAGFCGVWGLKPAYGRISRHGLVAYASSFDQIGFLSRHPENIARFLEVCAGPDAYDSTALRMPFAPVTPDHMPMKIAWYPEVLEQEGLDPKVRQVVAVTIDRYRAAGHTLVPVQAAPLPGASGKETIWDFMVPAYYVLTTAEASSNLARYDGIRYGCRSPEARTLEETYTLTRSEGFGDEVKRRILLGTFVLSSGYYDAYYRKAQQVRRIIQEQTLAVLQDCDFILLPVAPTVAWQLGEKSDDPVEMYLADIYTVQASLAGLPALAVPAGTHPGNGMPIGVQLIGGFGDEVKLLDFAESIHIHL